MTVPICVARKVPVHPRYGPHWSLRIIGAVDNEWAKLRMTGSIPHDWQCHFEDRDQQRFVQGALSELPPGADLRAALRTVKAAARAWERGE